MNGDKEIEVCLRVDGEFFKISRPKSLKFTHSEEINNGKIKVVKFQGKNSDFKENKKNGKKEIISESVDFIIEHKKRDFGEAETPAFLGDTEKYNSELREAFE